ncbi:MAG TPA: hypothetical protein VIO94_04860 [Phenylobacterium sp.]
MRAPLAMLSLAALAAVALPAYAEVDDTAYVQAARCTGLARVEKLGSPDAAAFKAFLDAERPGQTVTTIEQGRIVARQAERDARSALGAKKVALEAELAGACQAFKTQIATSR